MGYTLWSDDGDDSVTLSADQCLELELPECWRDADTIYYGLKLHLSEMPDEDCCNAATVIDGCIFINDILVKMRDEGDLS